MHRFLVLGFRMNAYMPLATPSSHHIYQSHTHARPLSSQITFYINEISHTPQLIVINSSNKTHEIKQEARAARVAALYEQCSMCTIFLSRNSPCTFHELFEIPDRILPYALLLEFPPSFIGDYRGRHAARGVWVSLLCVSYHSLHAISIVFFCHAIFFTFSVYDIGGLHGAPHVPPRRVIQQYKLCYLYLMSSNACWHDGEEIARWPLASELCKIRNHASSLLIEVLIGWSGPFWSSEHGKELVFAVSPCRFKSSSESGAVRTEQTQSRFATGGRGAVK